MARSFRRFDQKIALAPERQGVEEFVKQVTEEGVVVSLGHSNATLEEAQKLLKQVPACLSMLSMGCAD